MKRVNVAKLKAELSHYLRLVQRGEEVVVLDRRVPVAKMVSLPRSESMWQRLAREGRCKLGSQQWDDFKVPRLKRAVPIEEILQRASADLK